MKVHMDARGDVTITPDGNCDGCLSVQYFDGAAEVITERDGKLHFARPDGQTSVADSLVIPCKHWLI